MADWMFESARANARRRPSVTTPRRRARRVKLVALSAVRLELLVDEHQRLASSPAGVPSAASRSACRTYLRTAAARTRPGRRRRQERARRRPRAGRAAAGQPAPRHGAADGRADGAHVVQLARPPLVVTRSAGKSRASRPSEPRRAAAPRGGGRRAGDTATRACTTTCDAPAAAAPRPLARAARRARRRRRRRQCARACRRGADAHPRAGRSHRGGARARFLGVAHGRRAEQAPPIRWTDSHSSG